MTPLIFARRSLPLYDAAADIFRLTLLFPCHAAVICPLPCFHLCLRHVQIFTPYFAIFITLTLPLRDAISLRRHYFHYFHAIIFDADIIHCLRQHADI